MKQGIGRMGGRWNGWFLPLLLGSFLLAGWAAGQGRGGGEAERVALTVGAIKVLDLPFDVSGFRASNPEVVKAEATGNPRQVRVVAVKLGSSDVQVTGEGGQSALFSVSVIENIREVLAAMKRDLDALPELELGISRDRVVIKGEVSSVDHWETLMKVLAAYEKQYLNLASFRPAPEVMLSLKSALEKGGVKVAMDKDATKTGEVALKYSGSAIFVNGAVFSQRDIDAIKAVIAAQDWMLLGKSERPEDKHKVQAVLNLRVEPVMIELDAVYVGVSDLQNEKIGTNLAKDGLLLVDTTTAAFAGALRGGSGFTGGYTINSGLQGALNFFAKNEVKRFRSAGHMAFKSNDTPTWRIFQSGGTLKVKIAGTDGAAGKLEDIDYGLIMKVKGGLADASNADLEIELELSAPELLANGDYDLKRNRISTSLTCPLDKTMVIGGMRDLVQNTTGPSGVPFLRSIPVVQWFFSEKEDKMANMQVLILVSPRLAGAPKVSVPVSEETKDTEAKAATPNQERMEKGGKKRRWFFF
ncbi:MAG: pilus assembly protein N-terminal domain-containing protein [Lentisphaeria bacterium]